MVVEQKTVNSIKVAIGKKNSLKRYDNVIRGD